METWQWLVFCNIPFMVVNLWGIWIATTIVAPKPAKICFWVNVGAFVLSIGNILANSLILVCTYPHGSG